MDELAETLSPFWQRKFLIFICAVLGLVAAALWILFREDNEMVFVNIEHVIDYERNSSKESPTGTLQRFKTSFRSPKNFQDWAAQNASFATHLTSSDVTSLSKSGDQIYLIGERYRTTLLDIPHTSQFKLTIRTSNKEKINAVRNYAIFTSKKVTEQQISELDYLIGEFNSLLQSGAQLESPEFRNLLNLQTSRRDIQQAGQVFAVSHPSLPLSDSAHPGLVTALGAFFGVFVGVIWVFFSILMRRMENLTDEG